MAQISAKSQRRHKAFLPAQTLFGFVLAILAVLVIAVLSYRSLTERALAVKRVQHSVEVLARTQQVLSTLKDAETGQRGFLLTSSEIYLDPYFRAKSSVDAQFSYLLGLVSDNNEQRLRVESLRSLGQEKMTELEQTIEQSKTGRREDAMNSVRGDRGRLLMDRIRVVVGEICAAEEQLLTQRNREFQEAARLSTTVTLGGSGILLLFFFAAAVIAARTFQRQEEETWLRRGRVLLGQRLQGEQRLLELGENMLAFLSEYLDAQVGAIYIADENNAFRRTATIGLDSSRDTSPELLVMSDGIAGQALREQRVLEVKEIPADRLVMDSSLVRVRPRSLLVLPAHAEGEVQAVVELGFLAGCDPSNRAFLDLVSESIAIAVRSSKHRTRLQELLEETQRQGEELQTQQEELRVTNEELAEQSRALQESHAHLEEQRTELEQTNVQLEEQATELENQRDELARAQVDIKRKADEVEQTSRYKSEFLANMSHELRTPLNSSLILAKILAENRPGNLTADQVKYAQTISNAGNDLLSLINDILDLSKIESGNVEVIEERVVLHDLLERMAATFRPVAMQKNIDFQVQLSDVGIETFQSDAQRLSQILRNLLSNACKFTDQGKVLLRVSTNKDAEGNDQLVFAVSDTGIGVAPEHLSAIFDPFRQADGTTHRKYGGTGLGLSISRDLAHLLGGDLTVESTLGSGSVFTLVLPLGAKVRTHAEAQAARPKPSKDTSSEPILLPISKALSKASDSEREALSSEDEKAVEHARKRRPEERTLLVIEDDKGFATLLVELAQERQFQCLVAHSADEGLALAISAVPNAILLDVSLPDHSGLSVLDRLKRSPRTRHIPVHIISGHDYTETALSMGAIGYARKPVQREQVLAALGALEAKLEQKMRRVLVVEDDDVQRESVALLLSGEGIQIVPTKTAKEALDELARETFDCIVMDLALPDASGYDLLERLSESERFVFPPVIVYTGRSLSDAEELQLRKYSSSIIIKGARSPERLLDEVTLFLHQVEATLPVDRQEILRNARNREASFAGKFVLLVEDDVRNIYALSNVLEPQGAKLEIARNGKEALACLDRAVAEGRTFDLILMDIMMPEMDGLTATREIRKRSEWQKTPIIALTAKAMKDDQDICLKAGMNDYVSKPIDVDKLLSLSRIWLAQT